MEHLAKLVVGLVGPAGSGKTTLAKMMVCSARERGGLAVAHIKVSGDILGNTLRQYGAEPTRENLQSFCLCMQQLRPGAVSFAVINAIKAAPEPVVIWDCIRTEEDYAALCQFPNYALVCISTANEKIRFDRMRHRSEKGERPDSSDDEFRQAEQHAIERAISALCAKATHTIKHDSDDRDEFRSQVIELMAQLNILAL